MSSKSRLLELNQELGRVFKEIEDICSDEYRSIVIAADDQFNESFGTIVGSFSPRLDNFRNKINKIADKFPSKRKRNK